MNSFDHLRQAVTFVMPPKKALGLHCSHWTSIRKHCVKPEIKKEGYKSNASGGGAGPRN
jgi:hypothetical protein